MSSTSTASSTSIGGIIAVTGAVLNTTAKALASSSVTPDSIHKTTEPMFLQTKLAQGIAGFFVWVALFLSCQQVYHLFFNINKIFSIFLNEFLDLLSSSMVHKPSWTKMDRQDIVYSSHLCVLLVGQPVVFQFGELLRIFFYCSRLLWR